MPATFARHIMKRLDVILNKDPADQPNLKSKSMHIISQRLLQTVTQLSTFETVNISAEL